jgi:hypothetical protein
MPHAEQLARDRSQLIAARKATGDDPPALLSAWNVLIMEC